MCAWSGGTYLVPGGVPGPGGVCVPGPRGGTWSGGVYLVWGGGVPGPGGVPGQVLPPCEQNE